MKVAECIPDHDLLAVLEGQSISSSMQMHLDECTACKDRLSSLRREMSTLRRLMKDLPPEIGGEAPAGNPGMVGKYVIVAELGEGGQAVVYRAIHPGLNRDVVIKLSRKTMDGDSEGQHLVVSEGRVLAELDHPNLARVYDLDFHERRPFLAMEYVRGRTLEAWAKQAHPSARQSAAILAPVARALAAAHQRGIVHQDIKPRNILIDDGGAPKLIDFGMARLKQAWADDQETGGSGGTIAYMAPEQARGDIAQVGPATDIFALGAVLYWLLTGKSPFGGGEMADSLSRACKCAFDREALGAAAIPRSVARVCLKSMSLRPEDRYSSAAAMAAALERCARRPVVLTRALLVAGVLLAAIGAGTAVYSHLGSGPVTNDTNWVSRSQDIIRVVRQNEPRDLAAALPLLGDDRLEVVCDVPRGWTHVMLALRTDGQVTELRPAEYDGPDGRLRLKYPGGGKAAQLDPAAGTELIVVCASPRKIDVEALRKVMGSRALPALPLRVAMRMEPGEVTRIASPGGGEAIGEGQVTGLTMVEERLERIRGELLRQKVPLMEAVAYAH